MQIQDPFEVSSSEDEDTKHNRMLKDLAEEFPEDVPDPYDEEEDENYGPEEEDLPAEPLDDDDDPPETDRAALETGRKLISSPKATAQKPFPPKQFAEFNEDFKVYPDPRLAFDDSFPAINTSLTRSRPRTYDPEEYNPKFLNEADIIFAQRDLEEKKRNEEMF